MPVYKSHKKVEASPLTRGAYNAYRGWKTPENENPNDEGYLVEYLDGGKPNDDRHKGYISWSPKEQFDNGYTKLDELDELSVESIASAFNLLIQDHPNLVQAFLSNAMVVEQDVCTTTNIQGTALGTTKAVVNPLGIFNALLGNKVLTPIYNEKGRVEAVVPEDKANL